MKFQKIYEQYKNQGMSDDEAMIKATKTSRTKEVLSQAGESAGDVEKLMDKNVTPGDEENWVSRLKKRITSKPPKNKYVSNLDEEIKNTQKLMGRIGVPKKKPVPNIEVDISDLDKKEQELIKQGKNPKEIAGMKRGIINRRKLRKLRGE